MHEVDTALIEMKGLYERVLGRPAPTIEPHTYVPFPAGVDPVGFAIEEVRQVVKLADEIASAPSPASWVPRADAMATRDGVVIHLEIPGIAREDVKVYSTGGELVVRGVRKPSFSDVEGQPLALERPCGQFERRFVLPAGVQIDKTTARYAQGILELKIVGTAIGLPGEKHVEVG